MSLRQSLNPLVAALISLGAIQTCLTLRFALVYSEHVICTDSFHRPSTVNIYSTDPFFVIPIVKNYPVHSLSRIVDSLSLLSNFPSIPNSSKSLDNIFKQA